MTDRDLIDLVALELYHLRSKATTEEIEKLNFNTLSPQSRWSCIYGQMTGSCESDRAVELAKGLPFSFSSTSKSSKFTKKRKHETKPYRNFTPLEVYIYSCKNKQLKYCLDFLKGKHEILDLIELI